MSDENVEVARAVFEVWNTGDVDAYRELHHPDVILRTVPDWPEAGTYVGREVLMQYTRQLRETWDTDSFELIGDLVDVADRVVVRFVWHGVGHGPESNLEMTDVLTVRNGKVLGHEFFWDHDEALEALGLSERDRPAPP